MKKLNIWLLQVGEPYPLTTGVRKMRTALIADKLIQRGHRVYWWGNAFEHQRKKWLASADQMFEIGPDYAIHLLRGCGYRKNISLRRYFDHILVARKFKLQSENFEMPDIIVASMPCHHMAYEAMLYAKKHNVPIIVDIRDLWPDIFIEPLKQYKLQRIGKLFLTRDFIKLKRLIRKADALIAISKGCLDWSLTKIGRSVRKWDRVFYHGYIKNSFESISNKINSDPLWGAKKVFLFVGTFGKSYELELIINVARRYNEMQNSDIAFCIAGTGDQYDSLKEKVAKLPNVSLPGWVDNSQIQRFLQCAWAGIVPCRSVENAAPNKVFEYLSAGLPLISSLEGEIADLIQRHRIGVNYKAGDSEELYQCIKKLSGDTNLRNNMSQAASFFFREFGDADRIYDEYANHIEKLVEYKNKFVKSS